VGICGYSLVEAFVVIFVVILGKEKSLTPLERATRVHIGVLCKR
jgi:hypothetical protein